MEPSHAIEKIAILDCGAQYTKVIDRRIRELNVATEIMPLEVPLDQLRNGGFSGIILSGGPNSVYEEGAPRCSPELFQLGLPILGICYGMQLLTLELGGTVQSANTREYGETNIHVDDTSPLFDGLDNKQWVLMSHGDHVTQLAPGFRKIGESNGGIPDKITAAVADPARKIYGVQFHPEVELTQNGSQMLANFLYKICGLSGNYLLEDRVDRAIAELRQTVGDRKVFVLVSGGVDSSVTAALLVKALDPDQVHAVHIDSGFMRKGESDLVCEALKAIGLTHLRRIDAEEVFLNACTEMDGKQVGPLNTVTDPETKRQIIGDVFYRLINKAVAEADMDVNEAFIAQGTLRPDLIESGNRDISATAHTIKTHHNDVALIREHRERGLIIEPNKDWHKDEVRQVGRMLGLPEELVIRQPFPGPGLAIRVLCTEKPYVTIDYGKLNSALHEMAQAENLKGLLLPVKSVGVQGDARTYSYLAAIAGDYEALGWERLRNMARDIPNRLHAINRVALVINKPDLPDVQLSVTPTHLTKETLDMLRELDHIVTGEFKAAGLLAGISQLLTVLVPVDTRGGQGHSIAIRAVVTSDYMTARPASLSSEIPFEFMRALAEKLTARHDIDLVMYDMTGKPPATVEWE